MELVPCRSTLTVMLTVMPTSVHCMALALTLALTPPSPAHFQQRCGNDDDVMILLLQSSHHCHDHSPTLPWPAIPLCSWQKCSDNDDMTIVLSWLSYCPCDCSGLLKALLSNWCRDNSKVGETQWVRSYSLAVESTLQVSLAKKLSHFGVRENLTFRGVSPRYLYIKGCLSLYVDKCHKGHNLSIKNV